MTEAQQPRLINFLLLKFSTVCVRDCVAFTLLSATAITDDIDAGGEISRISDTFSSDSTKHNSNPVQLS